MESQNTAASESAIETYGAIVENAHSGKGAAAMNVIRKFTDEQFRSDAGRVQTNPLYTDKAPGYMRLIKELAIRNPAMATELKGI
jgi:hypothetical protein